jgi:hypothetical protein
MSISLPTDCPIKICRATCDGDFNLESETKRFHCVYSCAASDHDLHANIIVSLKIPDDAESPQAMFDAFFALERLKDIFEWRIEGKIQLSSGLANQFINVNTGESYDNMDVINSDRRDVWHTMVSMMTPHKSDEFGYTQEDIELHLCVLMDERELCGSVYPTSQDAFAEWGAKFEYNHGIVYKSLGAERLVTQQKISKPLSTMLQYVKRNPNMASYVTKCGKTYFELATQDIHRYECTLEAGAKKSAAYMAYKSLGGTDGPDDNDYDGSEERE